MVMCGQVVCDLRCSKSGVGDGNCSVFMVGFGGEGGSVFDGECCVL